MRDLIRPEVRIFLKHYAQALTGAVLTALALYWTLTIPGVLHWITGAFAVIAAALTVDGIRRGRLLRESDEVAGVLEIDERRILWMTGEGGAALSINELVEVDLLRRGRNTFWRLKDRGGQALLVPYTAKGAEGLIDGLAVLDGIDFSLAAKALGRKDDHTTVLWRASPALRSRNGQGPLT